MSRNRMQFLVTLTPPSGATAADLRAYIGEAVKSMKGCYHPEDPLFDLEPNSVKVKHVKPPSV